MAGQGDVQVDDVETGASRSTRLTLAQELELSCKSRAQRVIAVIDQWGEAEPLPKSVHGGMLTMVFLGLMLAYTVYLYIVYRDRPNVAQTSFHWSQYEGPYPMHLTCRAEHCFVSMTFGATPAGGAACVQAIPPEQLNQCIRLQPGDHIVVQMCYTGFPGQGLLLRFGGAPAWNNADKLGLEDVAMQQMHGFSITSSVPGDSKRNVIYAETPLSSGSTLLSYVQTTNETLEEGEEGNKRHEWFALQTTDVVPPSRVLHDACGADNASQVVALRMAPDFIKHKVSPPEEFVWAWFGEIGGASEICGVGLFAVLFVLHWLKCVTVDVHVVRENVKEETSATEETESRDERKESVPTTRTD